MFKLTESTHNLRRNLREIAEQQNLSARIGEYLEGYFADVELSGVSDGSPEELLGAAVQHFRLGDVRAPKQTRIALYTPDFDRHGWHSEHTVIDVVTDDMPFLVDSISMLVYRHGLAIHRLLHPLLSVGRSAGGTLQQTLPRGAAGGQPESWIHLEIDRIGEAAVIDDLQQELVDVLADVRAAVDDGATMQQRMHDAALAMAATLGCRERRSGGLSALDCDQQLRLPRLCRIPYGRCPAHPDAAARERARHSPACRAAALCRLPGRHSGGGGGACSRRLVGDPGQGRRTVDGAPFGLPRFHRRQGL
jgi:hypothetical protein